MIFLFFNTIFSKTVIDFSTLLAYGTITLYFGPLDEIEIKVKKGYGTMFGYWIEDLYLYVDADTRYGPFDEESGLAGVFFKNIDYSVLLLNDGLNNLSFLVKIGRYYPYPYDPKFPVSLVSSPGEKIGNLTSPFIYYIDESGYKYVVIIMSIILAFVSIGPIVVNCY